jgi:hypothetical protein
VQANALRVQNNTAEEVNSRIRAESLERVRRLANDPDAIARRLEELDQESDIERVLMMNASAFSLLGLGLGAAVDRRFFLLPGFVASMLLMHSIQGWCPPMPLFRNAGIRTAREIEVERNALKGLRGDFSGTLSPDAAFAAAELAT